MNEMEYLKWKLDGYSAKIEKNKRIIKLNNTFINLDVLSVVFSVASLTALIYSIGTGNTVRIVYLLPFVAILGLLVIMATIFAPKDYLREPSIIYHIYSLWKEDADRK